MHNKKLLPFILILSLLSGCAGSAPNQSADTEPSQNDPAVTDYASSAEEAPDDGKEDATDISEGSSAPAEEEKEETLPLSEEELQEFTQLFSTPEYNGFLIDPFNDPDDINWDTVLDSGAGINDKNISDDEIADYLARLNQRRLYTDLIVIRNDVLSEFVRSRTGTDFDPGSAKDWTYIAKHNSYYKELWTPQEKNFTCISGEKTGDIYTLRFSLDSDVHFGADADRILTCRKEGDFFIMESNAIQWEDYCDETQTFDVQLSDDAPSVRFITYPSDQDYGVKMVLVDNGKLMDTLYSGMYKDQVTYDLKKVSAAGFFDFSADGIKDIVIIGESDLGENILIYESSPADNNFRFCYNSLGISEELEAALGKDFTVNKVKELLLGDNTESVYGSYKDAYAQVAKLSHLISEEVLYSLIDTDGDGIPELVADNPGYYTSLYTYEDGHARCLMNGWAYGAMGNTGYDYVPGKGIFYNHNNDYAGLVQYFNYMFKHEEGELKADYVVESLMFEDKDGDGSPSEDEYTGSDELKVYEERYYNETGIEMTEDELRAKVDLLKSYEYESLGGDMDYAALLEALGKEG